VTVTATGPTTITNEQHGNNHAKEMRKLTDLILDKQPLGRKHKANTVPTRISWSQKDELAHPKQFLTEKAADDKQKRHWDLLHPSSLRVRSRKPPPHVTEMRQRQHKSRQVVGHGTPNLRSNMQGRSTRQQQEHDAAHANKAR
jgi:hypothetical protein